MSAKLFANQKSAALSGQDFSRKGSVDEPIKELVQLINSLEQFFTTSSCSGRIIVLSDKSESDTVQKEGCKWIYVSHDKSVTDEVIANMNNLEGDVSLKYEAFVMHVQCRTLDDAQQLLSCGVQAGFRNSGISLKSRKNEKQDWPKIMVALRSTHGIEAPIAADGKIIVTPEYIHHTVTKANTLMDENLRRIARFQENIVKNIIKQSK